jgi:ATP/ADP translocase
VDVLGARMGRSLGSASQQVLVLVAGGSTILKCAPAMGILYLAAVFVWCNAVTGLSKLFMEDEAAVLKRDARKRR